MKGGVSIKKQEKRKETVPIYTKFPPLLICAALCVSVLFAVPSEVALSEEESYLVPSYGSGIIDYCIRGREVLLFSVAVVIVLFWLGERIFPDRPRKSVFVGNRRALIFPVLCGVYGVFAALSSVLGGHPQVSFWGFATESEGVAAVLGYVVLFLASYEYFRTRESLKFLSGAVFVITAVIDILFIIERLSGPLIMTIFGIPDERTGTALLFGNSSSCGDFCAVIAVAAMGFAFCEEKKPLMYIKAALAGGTMLTVITTFSSAAVYGMLCGVLFTAVFLIVKCRKGIKRGLAFAVTLVVPLVLFTVIAPDSAMTFIRSDLANSGTYSVSGNFQLQDISMENNVLTISDSQNTMNITSEPDGAFVFADGTGTELCRLSEGKAAFRQPYSEITAEIDEGIITLDLGYDSPVSFATYEGAIQFVGMNGYLEPELDKSAFPELSEYYSFGTGRGYIWLNTLPILRDSAIVGCGAGQYAFRFPQNDIVGSLNTHGKAPMLTDKPHCMYLGIAVSYGIPALIIFAAITIVSLKRGLFKFWNQSGGIYAGIVGAILCFLIMGIANDSSPVISPLFWTLLGTAATADNVQDN